MAAGRHIKVILPLKLEWEPFYALPEDCCDLQVGDRVAVPFAGRSYLGVVSETDVTPPAQAAVREKEIYGPRPFKQRILRTEIEFFRSIASYYMCTVGEVYKAAYPSVKDELVSPRKKEGAFAPMVAGNEDTSQLHLDAVSALRKGKPLVISCDDDVHQLLSLCLDEALGGGSVLWLVPELKFGKALESTLRESLGSRLLVWGSDLTPARKREVARRMRSGEPYVVLGTRSALFLPHNSLTMVIVQDEFDPSYKQTSPAPRLNARDAAILLARIFSAKVVLSARMPSLETQFNCLAGKYLRLCRKCADAPKVTIVDTRAELRKNGMSGDLSRKLIAAVSDVSSSVIYKPRRAAFPSLEQLSQQIAAQWGDRAPLVTDDLIGNPPPEGCRFLAIFGVDSLLGRADFRADERALQLVTQAVSTCLKNGGEVLIQTRVPLHPVFAALYSDDVSAMLDERRGFNLPPFSRLVDVLVQDSSVERARRFCEGLSREMEAASLGDVQTMPDRVRISLPRNSRLPLSKERIRKLAESFAKESHYGGHLSIDVDPQV